MTTRQKRNQRKGELGELLYEQILDTLGFAPLTNLILPTKSGGYTEIDMLIADTTGIYPIEVKNYNARLYGNDEMRYWQAYYPNGKKYQMYNPIKQNDTHRRAVEHITGYKNKTLSFVVFTENANIEGITNKRTDVLVCRPRQFIETLGLQLQHAPEILTIEDLHRVYNKLKPYENPSEKIRQAHLKYVKKIQKKYK